MFQDNLLLSGIKFKVKRILPPVKHLLHMSLFLGLALSIYAETNSISATKIRSNSVWLDELNELRLFDRKSQQYLTSFRLHGDTQYFTNSEQFNRISIQKAVSLQNTVPSGSEAAYRIIQFRLNACDFRNKLELIAQNEQISFQPFNHFNCVFYF